MIVHEKLQPTALYRPWTLEESQSRDQHETLHQAWLMRVPGVLLKPFMKPSREPVNPQACEEGGLFWDFRALHAWLVYTILDCFLKTRGGGSHRDAHCPQLAVGPPPAPGIAVRIASRSICDRLCIANTIGLAPAGAWTLRKGCRKPLSGPDAYCKST